MSFFVQSAPARPPKSRAVRVGAAAYAGILTLMTVAQLFHFEDFLLTVDSFWLPGGAAVAAFLATWIIILQIFALPFLLTMRLSPAMRVVSMISCWLVPLLWVAISVWLVVTTNAVQSSGMLGSVMPIPPGVISLSITGVLVVLAVFASWGLWPFGRRTQK